MSGGTLCYKCMRETMVNGRCTACGASASDLTVDESGFILRPGTRLDDGDIIIGDKLGSGGFGITYIALDRLYGRVALKEFAPKHMVNGRRGLELLVNPDQQEIYEKSMRSFRRESHLLSQLNHPNIVKVLFDLTQNNTAYYGMQLLEGEDLGQYVRRKGALSPQEACELLMPIVDALIYLHQNDVQHRDLSPDNIFLIHAQDGSGQIKPCLIDFGAAYIAIQNFTQTVPGVKKNGYSPLEQNWGRDKQGPFTDVYAFCATLYYVLTMRVPIPASDRMQNAKDQLQPPSTWNANVSPALDRLIMHGLAILYKERIPDMVVLKRGLEKAIPKPEPKPEPKLDPEPKHVSPVTPVTPVPPVPPPAPKRERSCTDMLALLIEHLIFWGLPALMFLMAFPDALSYGGSVSESGLGLAFVMGSLIMLLVNVLLCCTPSPGTLGERIFGTELYALRNIDQPSTGCVLCYCLFRVLPGIALADELIAYLRNAPSYIKRALGLSTQEREQRSASNDQSTVSRQVSGEESIRRNRSSSADSDRSAPPYGNRPNPSPRAINASLLCIAGMYKGKTFPLNPKQTFGRDEKFASVHFPESYRVIGHRHCMVTHDESGSYVKDMRSLNKTFLNGEPIMPDVPIGPLKVNDVISFASEMFVYKEN